MVHISYGPHTPLSVYWGWYFSAPDTHVLCTGSRTATGIFAALRLVHSLLKYFFKFQLWYWIQFYTTKYSNLILIFRLLVWIFGSTYRKGEILKQKWHVNSQFFYCYTSLTRRRASHGVWHGNVTYQRELVHVKVRLYIQLFELFPQPGPDLDMWGPLGRLSCGGPQYDFYGSGQAQFRSKWTFRNAGSGEAPLGTSAAFFFFWSAYLTILTQCVGVWEKTKIVLNFVVENNNLILYARASERLINMHIFKSQ